MPPALEEKETYATIQKVKTFTPPSDNRDFVFAQLAKNIENACTRRRHSFELGREPGEASGSIRRGRQDGYDFS